MNRDPLYRKIVDALARPLDGNIFQDCAVALIGKAHPNLAPLPGGDDAGMDGAFGTPDGPYPLVCTVQSDVIGNFRKNISTYLAKRKGPKLAVVATSQQLSNRRKRNLEKEAAKFGLTLVNIYDAPYFANQLYRESRWRLELLGITGELPALSLLPRRGRFAQPGILVGREEDLAWLKEIHADALLVGQPGSGKTYLHQHLANQNLCLFAVDDSSHRLADAIREQQPSIVVVDDAHIHLTLVEDLKRLRAELDAKYHLHLNCWPHHEASVQRILNIPDNRVRRLQPLRRQAVFELIRKIGINGPDWLQHLLISQSDGKPGLATALAELCRIEDVAHIWSGEATARQLLGDLRLAKDEKERCVLAAFAVGGDIGMSFGDVSKALELPQIELRQITAGLGSGGLVEEVGEDRLQVRPPAIRPVLVRDVFYCGASSQPIAPLLSVARSAASTATVLLNARQRGAQIDHSLLEKLVATANTHGAWEHFGWVDSHCAGVILDKYPRQVCHGAPGLLNYSPHRALNALLDADEAKLVRQAGAIEHPRRRIIEWLFPFDALPDVTIERRQILLDVLGDRTRQDKVGDGASFTWALAALFQASFETVRQSPGNIREFHSIRGVASPAILTRIASLWPASKELFRHVPHTAARVFFDQLENWCLPQRLSLVSPLPADTYAMVRQHGKQMLLDILQMPHCNRAWQTRAATMAKWGNLNLDVEVDRDFDAIYADRDHSDSWEQEQKKRTTELHEVACNLLNRGRDEVLQYLDDIRTEAMDFGYRNGNGYLWVIYNELAAKCKNHREWLDALVARNAPGEFLSPFLDRIIVDPVQYEAALEQLLKYSDYQPFAINRIIRLSQPHDELLSSALGLLNDPELVEHLWLRDSDIPLAVMSRILKHPNPRIRGAAAMGEWQREPVGTVRPELSVEWRLSIRDVAPNHYALKDVFESEHALAFEWLHSQIKSGSCNLSVYDQALHAACKVLDNNQRTQLLQLFTRDSYSEDCFDLVMGDHTGLFADWLGYQADEYLRLRPLDRDVGPRWEQMAQLALDAGVSPDVLADHCTPNHWSSSREYYLGQDPIYQSLATHPDMRLRRAGERGLAWVRDGAQRELERERREETYGE